MQKMVLSLYDFASKQEYIYRTSKIKEISGASALLEGIYARFPAILKPADIQLSYNTDERSPFSVEEFENSSSHGEVVYDGGGNLMVLWKSFETYEKANRLISAYLLKNAPGLSLIACHVPYTGLFDDSVDATGKIIRGDRTRLYEQNALRKNRIPPSDMPSVMPFTQIDTATFLPVTYKRNQKDPDSAYPASACSLSSDRYIKAAVYKKIGSRKNDLPDKDGEGMLAVIYIDGNSMGNKLISCRSQSYDEGVKRLREFSEQVKQYYVDVPIETIRKSDCPFRKVIGGGDEITLICKAENAFQIMREYFNALAGSRIRLPDKSYECTSCAGISVFHAKAPFNVAYDIAEAACEEAKKKAHEKDGNYFCFYYCHAGVTNTFERLHNNEQKHASGKPYCTTDLDQIDAYAKKLRAAGRANAKALGDAAQISLSRYQYETKRVNAYLKNGETFKGTEEEMKLVYDLSEFFDLWFVTEGKEKKDEKNA